jgi:hypothetical protein
MWHFGSPVELQHVARGLVASERSSRFERYGTVAADRQIELDDHMRLGASLIGFMAFPTLMLVQVRSTRFAGRDLAGWVVARD